MKKLMSVFAVVVIGLAACGKGDCEVIDCGDEVDGLGDVGGKAGRLYEQCVSSSAISLYDDAGTELSYCQSDYEGIEDKNDCAQVHFDAKYAYCTQ
jgi:hypothetical protein